MTSAEMTTRGGNPAGSWRRSKCCAVLFRLSAVLLALLPLALAEAVCVGLGLGRPDYHEDPFVGFSAVRPLFIVNDDGTRFVTAPSRRDHFALDSFAANKPAGEFRIFALGGSTVQGNPYSIPTSFTTWLEISLHAADPRHPWEVVNCGGISYASYRLVPVMQEALAYQPDLFILYTGQNEFLEDRTYGHIKRAPQPLAATHELVSQLRVYNLLRSGYLSIAGRERNTRLRDRATLNAEVEALLDYRGGMEFYHRDEAWRTAVMAHYEFNLRRMVHIAKLAKVPLILINPVCNLRDTPPFKSEHRTGLSAEHLARWEALWDEARQYYDGRYALAIPLLEQAIAIDNMHAGTYYELAKCYDAVGRLDKAYDMYLAAKELDVCPLRILEPMNQAVLDIARDTGTSVVDARKIFERLSPSRIPGQDWLLDHVHPTIRGHQVLADALMEEMSHLALVQLSTSWRELRDRNYEEHLRSLDTVYFVRGQQHLEGLTRWAEGRVMRERSGKSPP